jgi:serine/threonine protein kinase
VTSLTERYVLEDRMFEDGGGEFWRGVDSTLHRSVGVLIVGADHTHADDVLTAAKHAAAITDPRFLRILDAERVDGTVYIVSEWVEAQNLAVILRGGPLESDDAADLVREIAEALAICHGEGLAHRMLDAHSVLRTDSGDVKIVGIGVEAALHGVDPTIASRNGSREPPDPIRDDVRALGSLLFAGLTGQWPAGIPTRLPNELPLAPMIAGGTCRSPHLVRAAVPPALDVVTARVIGATPYAGRDPIWSAAAVGTALLEIRPPPPPAPRPAAAPASVSVPDELSASAPTVVMALPPNPAGQAAVPEPQHGGAGEAGQAAAATSPVEATTADPGRTGTSTTASSSAVAGTSPLAGRPAPSSNPAASNSPSSARASNPRSSKYWPSRVITAVCVALGLGAVTALGLKLAIPPKHISPQAVQTRPTTSFVGSQPLPVPTAPTGSGVSASGAGLNQPLPLAGARDFDPYGDGKESPQSAVQAIDGLPGTAWRTQTYRGRPDLGGLKPGVGLIVDLGSIHAISGVDLELVGSGTSLEIRVSTQGGNRLDAFGVVASAQNAPQSLTLAPTSGTVQARYVLIWLTRLPASGGGFRGGIDNVTIRGA